MGKIEISKLECLAKNIELVAPIEYNNPKREGDIFYQFIRDYGNQIGIPVAEKRIGFIDDRKRAICNVRAGILNSDMPLFERLIPCILVEGLNLVLTPIMFFNGPVGWVTDEGNSVRVNLPKFDRYKSHEYMHVYHLLVARDLKQRGLLQHTDGYNNTYLWEPQFKVPTKDKLKKFERRFLYTMIKQETKYL